MPKALKSASINNGFITFTPEINLKYLDYIISNGIQNSIIGIRRNKRNFYGKISDKFKNIVDIFYVNTDKAEVKDLAKKCFGNKLTLRLNELQEISRMNDTNIIDWKNIYKSMKNSDILSEENLSEIEKRVLNVWKKVLGLKQLGIDEDFFDCGGDSIIVSKLSFSLKQEFNKEISFQDILQNSTVRKCADLIEEKQKVVTFEEIKEDVEKEVYLKYPIEEYIKTARPLEKCKEVLLTGATGFLGAFVLIKLLQYKDIKVHLVVRADSDEKAEIRVKNNLAKYKILDKLDNNRVSYHKGDLKLPNLGVSSNVYEYFKENIDEIYHVASVVNFAVNFHALIGSNVDAVREVIKLASLNKIKMLHYISSFTVYSAMIQENHHITENSKLLFETPVVNEYNKSKWIADNIVQLAREKNVPAKIYRIGTLSGDCTNGICQTRDFMWLMIKVILTLKKAPILPMFGYNPVPVDTMANSIVELGKLPYNKEKATYNLMFQTITMDTLISWINKIEKNIEAVTYKEWRDELIEYSQKKNDTSLLSVLAVVPKPEIIENRTEQRVNSDLTFSIMKENNISNIGETFESFYKTYTYMKSIGFFD